MRSAPLDEQGRDFGWAKFFHRLAEQRQPAREMRVGELGDGDMLGHRPALVAAGAEQHRTPEIGDGLEVCRPLGLGDHPVEHWPDHLVLPRPAVEALDHCGDHRVIEIGRDQPAGRMQPRAFWNSHGRGLSNRRR